MRAAIPDIAFWRDTDVLRDQEPDFWVTIWVSGVIITGEVADMDRWIRATRATVDTEELPVDAPITSGLQHLQESARELVAKRDAVKPPTEGESLTPEQQLDLLAYSDHLHLVNAQTLTGDQTVPTRGGVAVRVRYASIDAWTYARLSATATQA